MCRRVDLRADNEIDAELLAMLAQAFFYGDQGSRKRLWDFLKKEKRRKERAQRKVELGKASK